MLAALVAAACAATLAGCNGFENHRQALEAMVGDGRYDLAARSLDDPKTRELYGDKNHLLWLLDRGSIALANHNPSLTIQTLEEAESSIELHSKPTAGDELGRWLWNDNAAPYYAEPYEDIYVNVLKLLAQLEAGNIHGGATVEARRLAGKADALRDQYLSWRDALDARGGADFQAALSSSQTVTADSLMSVNDAGEFLESTLGTYLTAITFMETGEENMQAVAGRRLLDSIRLQRGLIGRVDETNFQDLGEMPASRSDLLVVALSGTAPTKHAVKIGPIPVFTWPVYFELPELRGGSARAERVRVTATPLDSTAAEPITRELSLVEDMRLVAMENHRRQMPLIYARALLRSSIKAGASFALSESIRHSSGRGRDSERDLMTIGSVVAGIAVLMLTEKADLRCWSSLPALAHVGTLDLPPGRYRVSVEYLGGAYGGGILYTAPPREISVSGERLETVVERYWN